VSLLSDLRTLVFLRRIARASERIADSLAELQTIERSRWQRESRTTGRPIKPTVIEPFDHEAANDRYRRELEAASVGGVLED
jgi:hypothetical protein